MQTQLNKTAALGGSGGETEFEQAFSSLAYAYLRDKAPRLLDFMVGFQLVDRNEDNTKAMGIFGFQVGKQWLYAPVFFLNGDLKGHELLYMKNNDSFVPLKENWINYIMSRKPHILGEQSASKLRELGGVYPDIRTLSIPPSIGGGKRASDNSWLQGVMPMLAAFKTKAASSLYRGAGNRKLNQAAVVADPFGAALAKQASILDFNNVMPQSLELIKMAHAISERYPTIKQAMQKFYGVDCFSRWSKDLRNNLEKEASNILPVQIAAKPYMPGNLLIPTERPAGPIDHVKQGKLNLDASEYVFEQGGFIVDTLDVRFQVERESAGITDSRSDDEVSKAYNTQVDVRMTNPTETNLYRVLERPGKFSKMLVVMHGSSNRGREPFATLVRLEDNGDGGDKAWLNSHATNIFADQTAERDEWREWFESLPGSESLEDGGEYIAVSEDGSGTVPFHVQSNYGDGRHRVDFRTHVNFDEARPSTMPRLQKITDPFTEEGYHMPSTYGAMLYTDKEGKKGTRLRAIAGELRVPASFKFLKLSEPHKPRSGELMPCCNYTSRSDMPPIQLGKIDDIQLFFYEKTAGLQLLNNSTDVYIDSVLGSERVSLKEAAWHLVSVHGLREKAARELLEQSERKGKTSYRIEYAPGYGNQKQAGPNDSVLAGGPDAPIFDDFAEERSVENYGPRTSAPTQYGGEAAYRLNHLSADQTDPGVWNPWQNYEAEDFQKNVQQAQQAGAQGQKEVFDTSMISGMLKSVRQDSLVERHLAPLVESLDALGRLLMNFYWHGEEFEDRYGKSDMPELEDSLRNSFEALGDVTLFLKEKTVESPFDSGDVNLEETSRN